MASVSSSLLQALKMILACFAIFSFFMSQGNCASIYQRSDQLHQTRVRRNSSGPPPPPSVPSVCIPKTDSELEQEFSSKKNLFDVNEPIILPLSTNGKTMRTGILNKTLQILGNSTLRKCIESYYIDEDPKRYPRFLLLTSCKTEGNCNDLVIDSQDSTYVNVLQNDGCKDGESGVSEEKWSLTKVSISHCNTK